jgi:hypothetical protein
VTNMCCGLTGNICFQVERYVHNGLEPQKVNSDKNIIQKNSNKNTPSRQAKPNGSSSSSSTKKSKKKFKRSLTMTSLPLSFFKGCASGNSSSSIKDLRQVGKPTGPSATGNRYVSIATLLTLTSEHRGRWYRPRHK